MAYEVSPIAPKPGIYANGVENYARIVSAAEWVLIEKGHASLTLKRVADRSGLKIGHLYYYVKTKHDLIHAVLEALFAGFWSALDKIELSSGGDAEAKLTQILILWMEDNQTRRTSRVYTELWAMANHDPRVRLQLDDYYDRARILFEPLIDRMNPRLDPMRRQAIIIYMLSFLEGLVVFTSHGKPMTVPTSWVAAAGIRSILSIIKTGDIGDMALLSDRFRTLDEQGVLVSS